MITTGNGTPKKNSAANATAATTRRKVLCRVRRPTRITAWITIATTAACRPNSAPATQPTCP